MGTAASEKRRKRPETRKEALARLGRENEERAELKRMRKLAKSRNKNEFHFEFYSVDKNMRKKIKMDADDLRKTLRFIDREIKRSRKIVEESVARSGPSKHVRFTEDGEAAIDVDDSKTQRASTDNEYERYISELKEKRKEVVERLNEIE